MQKIKNRFLLSTVILVVVIAFAGILLGDSKVKAGVSDTFDVQFPDYNMAVAFSESLGKVPSDLITQEDIDSTATVFLQNKNINSIEGIGLFENIVALIVDNNNIQTIPDEIGNLTKVVNLGLHENQITNVSGNIGNLPDLRYITLHDNKLSSLSNNIVNTSGHLGITLFNNQLTALPDDFGQISTLEELYLANNQLTVLPNSITNLTNLVQLDLQYNNIKDLPEVQYQFILNVDFSLVKNQSYTETVLGSYNNGNIIFSSLPIFEQISTYGDGSSITYSLLKPSGATVTVVPVIAGGTVTIDKGYLDENGDYTLIGNVDSGALNPSEYIQSFTYNKSIPQLVLNEPLTVKLNKGTAFVEPGFTATDYVDGNITNEVVVSGTVNVNEVGIYILTYSVTNSFGEKAEAKRTIEVVDRSNNGGNSSTGNLKGKGSLPATGGFETIVLGLF